MWKTVDCYSLMGKPIKKVKLLINRKQWYRSLCSPLEAFFDIDDNFGRNDYFGSNDYIIFIRFLLFCWDHNCLEIKTILSNAIKCSHQCGNIWRQLARDYCLCWCIIIFFYFGRIENGVRKTLLQWRYCVENKLTISSVVLMETGRNLNKEH